VLVITTDGEIEKRSKGKRSKGSGFVVCS